MKSRTGTWVTAALQSPISLILVVTGLILAAASVVNPGFTSPEQLSSLLRLSAFLGFIAAGQTLVILGGNDGIDLSVGSVVTTAAVIVYALNADTALGLVLAIVAAIGAGLLIGALNGITIVALGLPPLVVTLAIGGVVNGVLLLFTNGRPVGLESSALSYIVDGRWAFGLPGLFLLWLLLALLLDALIRRSLWGRALIAVGSNLRAAQLSGYRTGLVRVSTYAVAGLLSALGGILLLGYTGSAIVNLGEPYTLPSVAAVVIGGTLMSGGIGSYWGTVAAAVFLTTLQSVLITLGLPEFGRQIFFGLLIAAVLTCNAVFRRA